MPDVHLERNLGLLVIATEVTFPDEQPEHEASFERIDRRSPDGCSTFYISVKQDHGSCCFTDT